MNVFKSSRFDCLNESNSQLNKRNSKEDKPLFKEDRNNNFKEDRNNNFKEDRNFFKNDSSRRGNRYETKESKEKREQFEKMRKEKEEKAKEEKNQKNLSADNFPNLHGSNVKTEKTIGKKESYVEKINKISIKEPTEVDHIKPGWVEVKRDHENPRKLIYTYGLGLGLGLESENSSHSKESSKKKLEPQVLDALVLLHNKRTQEYIDMWGYDTWEKLYRFPNYDYHYFDKLDEKYEEELEKELEEDDEYEY
jgi:hypothetical protein